MYRLSPTRILLVCLLIAVGLAGCRDEPLLEWKDSCTDASVRCLKSTTVTLLPGDYRIDVFFEKLTIAADVHLRSTRGQGFTYDQTIDVVGYGRTKLKKSAQASVSHEGTYRLEVIGIAELDWRIAIYDLD